MQGSDSLRITSGHVHHTITHSQVPKRCCLYSSLSLHLLSYHGEVANHLQENLTGLSALRLKLPAGLDGGCGWAGADPCCVYFTMHFCTLPASSPTSYPVLYQAEEGG